MRPNERAGYVRQSANQAAGRLPGMLDFSAWD